MASLAPQEYTSLLGDSLSYFACLFHLIFSLHNDLILSIFTCFVYFCR